MSSVLKMIPVIVAALLAVTYASVIALARSDGSSTPTGYTNVTGKNCTSCHSGTVNSGPGKLTIQAPATFAPGSVIPVTISLSSLQKITANGFQMAAYDGNLAVQAGWVSVDGNTAIRSNHLNQSQAGASQQAWRAYYQTPSNATTLQLFASGLDGNDDRDDTGDRTYTTSVKMSAAIVRLSMSAPPKRGTTVPLVLDSPGDAGKAYLLATSFGKGGIGLPGRRSVPLSLDALTILTLQNQAPSVFKNYQSTFNGASVATASIALPNVSALVGQSLHSAFIVVDASGPGGIGTISNGLEMQIF